ncbi:MAG: peptidylprolyl isomerase [Bacteroidetes bacterium]|jgi:peptidyl-prolyl cis-trans isomerase SurA|nr:peptidylprolyl isomerase [Bacteroidota bacterium]
MTLMRSLSRRRALPIAWIALFLLSVGLAVPAAPAHAQDQPVIDQIAAVVGNDIILQSEVENAARSMAQQQPNLSYNDQLLREALNQLIDQEVLANRAREDTTIVVSDQQLETQLDQQIQQIARRAGGEERLEEIYGQSILELKEDFREDVREQLLAQQLRARRMRTIEVTPSEVRQWFERIPQDSLPQLPTTVRLAHIVQYPKPTESARQEANEIITAIRDSIVQGGAEFEAMARQFSDDPGTAADGGRIAGVNLDDLVPEFAAVASRTPIGEISQVFYNDAQEGFHILRVNDRSGGTIDFNHILIQVDRRTADPQPVIDHLNAVRDTLRNMEVPFELMARRHSEEERTAENGGRVVDPRSGTRDLVLDALGPSWKSTLDTMETGEISQPTRVQLLTGDRAYHILQLQRRMPAHRVNLETDYERIKQFALQDKQTREMNDWINDLREEVYIDIRMRLDPVATATR